MCVKAKSHRNMKHTIKRFSCFLSGLASSAFLLVGFFAFLSSSKSVEENVLAPRHAISVTEKEAYTEEDFDTADEAPADFSIDIKSATSTPLSKRIKATFASSTKTGYRDSTGLFYMILDDERFSGNHSQPIKDPEDFPDNDVVFNGYTIAIDSSSDPGATAIYLPEYLKRGTTYRIRNLMIDTHAGTSYDSVRSIYIPNSVETVSFEAFINVPDDLTFYVEHESKPEGWDDEWCDGGKVVWGYTEIPNNKRSVSRNTATRTFGDVSDYYLGYTDPNNSENNRPLVVSYTVIDASGKPITRWEELPIESEINNFDGIGTNLGNNSMDRNIELDFEDGETLDYHSITFYNIYPLAEGETKAPDFDKPYYYIARKKFSEEYHVSNYLSYKFKETATFMNFTAVTMTIDRVTPSPYLTEMASTYEEKIDFIKSGRYVLRYAFYNLSACTYEVRYKDNGVLVEKKIPVKTPESAFAFNKEKNNQVTFLINNADVGKNFSTNKLVEFDISGLTLNMHLYDLDNNIKVGRTELTKTFGRIEIKSNDDSLKLFSIDVFFAVLFPVYFLLYALASTGLYFFLKEKNKNNEFKRMKTKPFVIKCVISAVCSSIVVLELLSILFRFTVINNSITVFNPIDIFIVFAGILSVIIIGYFIRYIYISVKNNLHRRQVVRLNLGSDEDDDGTK